MPIYQRIAVISVFIIITGIFTFDFFRALPSIGIAALTITAIYAALKQKLLYNSRYFLYLSLVFAIYLLSFIYPPAENSEEMVKAGLMKLPFLLFAFSFTVLPSFSAKQIFSIYYYFFGLVILTAAGTLINFIIHFEEITKSYLSSKIMPTPVNHVRYSLIVAYATCVGAYLYFKKFKIKYTWEVKVTGAATLFLFIFLHILSVRSGLLALYAAIFSFSIYLVIQGRNYKRAFILLIGLIFIPIAGIFTFPTLKNKITNTLEDLSKLKEVESANNYSLAGRVISYKVAWSLFVQHPLTGVGAANLKEEVHKVYRAEFPEITKDGIGILMPHNQFLVFLSATGIIGLIAFIIFFYSPLAVKQFRTFPLLSFHYLIITISFLFEGTLETQTGTNFTLIFIFLPLFYLKNHSIKTSNDQIISSYNYV